jgi:hypothetical protein
MNNARRTFVLVTLASLSLVALPGLLSWAADPRLDLANDALVKARALVAAAADPGSKKPFGGHADRAIAAIDRAIQEIQRAKQAADSHS